MAKYPDRHIITALVAADAPHGLGKKGDRVWLYWTPESGGWWQWGPEGWAERFPDTTSTRFLDALRSAQTMGPWYSKPDPGSIEVRQVPAHVVVTVS